MPASRSCARSRSRARSRSHSREAKRGRDHSRSTMSSRGRHPGDREDPDPSRCIGVFGLSMSTTERELEEQFGKFGPIEKVQVVLDGQSGRSRGFAFIYYDNMEDACSAREAMTGSDLDGRKVRVDFSVTKRAHTPTPGLYMGRPTGGGSGWAGGSARYGYSESNYYGSRRDDRRRSPSPYRRRSPSPYRRCSPSSYRRRSPSPHRRHSPSPYRRRRSPSQQRSFKSRSRSHRRREYSPTRH